DTRLLTADMSSGEASKEDVVKKPEADGTKDNADLSDGQELRFTPEEEEVSVRPSNHDQLYRTSCTHSISHFIHRISSSNICRL
ncbi:hypothetical protein, partial [Enterococcus faecalis]|uniref:hypothetical protein n=1 Tax=Enterococcus faecalis TaxID=1351 RepID=UPI003D6C3BFE